METIRGIVRKVLSKDEEKGRIFALVDYETPTGLVQGKIDGFTKDLGEGDYFAAAGDWREIPAKGRYPASRKLFCKSLQPDLPTTGAGALSWLSALFDEAQHGASPDSLKAFVARHGDRVAHMCEQNPELVVGVSRTPVVHRDAILKKWGRAVSGRRAFKLMEAAGLPPRAMRSIHDAFLDRTYEVIRTDPYKASRVKDVGFKNVDMIGQHIRIGHSDDRRVGAAMVEVLNSFRSEGATVARIDAVGERMDAAFGVSLDVATAYIVKNIHSVEAPFVVEEREGALVAALRDLRDGEAGIATGVATLLAGGRRNARDKVEQVSRAVFASNKDFERFDETQRAAVLMAATEPLSILTGGPGTGKSAVSEVVVACCRKLDRGQVFLCAPTGKAATRLEEATKGKATTIHSLLEAKEVPLTGGSTYGRNAKNPLPSGCVVLCDEASMLDVPTMAALFAALPADGRVILVGDKNQLPSVDAGATVGDLLASENGRGELVVPSTELVNVYRQSRTSSIATGAAEVRQGRLPFMSNQPVGGLVLFEHASSDILNRVRNFVQEVCVSACRLKPHQFVVLSPQSQGTAGTWEINRALSEMLNPRGRPIPGVFRGPEDDPSLPIPRVGDRVMATKNDRETGVSNGDVGTIMDAYAREGASKQTSTFIKVRFDNGDKQVGGKEVEFPVSKWRGLILAYAMTIHKSQGSQYHTVVMPVTMAHANMLDRPLFYTGWTRAKSLLCVVGEREAMEKAVTTVRTRDTRLREFVRAESARLGLAGRARPVEDPRTTGTVAPPPSPTPSPPVHVDAPPAATTPGSSSVVLPRRAPVPGRPAPPARGPVPGRSAIPAGSATRPEPDRDASRVPAAAPARPVPPGRGVARPAPRAATEEEEVPALR